MSQAELSKLFEAVSFPLSGRRLIEASAGTGKTYSITSLYIRLLLGHGNANSGFGRALKVNEILVVTFTNAATAELRGRIRERIVAALDTLNQPVPNSSDSFLTSLHQQLHGDPQSLNDAVRILTAAALMMDEAAIYSIHGFCSRMLSEFAFESNMPFEVTVEADDVTRLETAAKDTWLELVYGSDKQLADTITTRWQDPALMSNQLSALARQADITLELDESAPSLSQLSASVKNFKQSWLLAEPEIKQAVIKAKLLSHFMNNMEQWFSEMRAFANNLSLEPPPCLKQFTPQGFNSRKHMGKRSSMPEHPVFLECEELLLFSTYARCHVEELVISKIRARMRQESERTQTLTPDDLLSQLNEALQGDGGPTLATCIRAKYPVAMVDEFQDTDPVQYRIFDSIYTQDGKLGAGASGDSNRESDDTKLRSGLFLIGDPKQAIYKFRGADIYTYINAKRAIPGQAHYNLNTNYRSTKELISAINSLFQQPDPFLSDVDIPYIPVVPPVSPTEDLLAGDGNEFTVGGTAVPAMTIWHYTDPEAGSISYSKARSMVAEITANEVLHLLTSDTRVTGKPLREKEIAILVRSKTDAYPIIESLRARGIGSTFRQRTNVFTSEAAHNLWLTLKAALEPGNDRLVRAAYACTLMNRSLEQLQELENNADAYLNLAHQFRTYHELWKSSGVLPMLQAWLADHQILQKIRDREDSERMLTDLRQLGELLQMQSNTRSGMHELMQYLQGEMHKTEDKDVADDNMLRLESDENLVQIITIHAAKGLQFDVVMIPMAASAREENQPIYHRIPEGQSDFTAFCDLTAAGLSLFHTESSQNSLTPGQREVLERVNEERLAEDLRLFYVAVTRAKKKCYIGLANLSRFKSNLNPANLGFADSAPGHLLLGHVLSGKSQADDEVIRTALAGLATNSQIDIIEFSQPQPPGSAMLPPDNIRLRGPRPAPRIADEWKLASYSALTRNLHTLQKYSGTGDDSESEQTEPGQREEMDQKDKYSRFSFPRGAHTGVLLHTLFEELDFTADEGSFRDCIETHLTGNGFDPETDRGWIEMVIEWTMDILSSNLAQPNESPLTLRSIEDKNKIVEMEFYFPLRHHLTDSAINELLEQYGYLDPHQPLLEFSTIKGMMKGFIDLIFTHQGKCYLLDYKSNHLGNTVDDYSPDNLPRAIQTSRYDLQYLIYSLALHRYLKKKIINYDYDNHFGGAYYLYLRGMSGNDSLNGVYFDKPDYALIEALDQLFGPTQDWELAS
jgi:exodeoxyribonuclease V beta subunit